MKQQLVKGNSLHAAGTQGRDDVRSLSETRRRNENLLQVFTVVHLIQQQDGRVALAGQTWTKHDYNVPINTHRDEKLTILFCTEIKLHKNVAFEKSASRLHCIIYGKLDLSMELTGQLVMWLNGSFLQLTHVRIPQCSE